MNRALILFLFATCAFAGDIPDTLTEVVLIGTQHFITDLPEGYTPAHLRALLKKVAPNILAVEAPSNSEKPWNAAPLELAKVTKPWADENRLTCVPVGWSDEQYNQRLGEAFQASQKKDGGAAYQTIEIEFQRLSGLQTLSCEFMNSPAYEKIWRDYHAALRTAYTVPLPWGEWNEKIIANIIKLCQENRGRRIAVVFGAAHCYLLRDRLAQDKTLRLVPTESFFPLSPDEIAAQTRDRDYLMALRLLNFEEINAGNLVPLEKTLKKVEAIPAFQNDGHLFRGKFLLHSGKPKEAMAEFQKLANLDAEVLCVFDGVTHLREAGLVYVAIAKEKSGERVAARKELESLLIRPDIGGSTKDWVRQILTQKPK